VVVYFGKVLVIAEALGVPYHPTLVKTEDSAPKKAMETRARQLRNLTRSIDVDGDVQPTPVLLIDDIADSRWTLTYCAARLEAAGCRAVLPFALAVVAHAVG
jgi:ATP-dependent DNA helicase RecQ